MIDLRKAIELRPPDSQGSFEAQCSFQIVAPSKYVADIQNVLLAKTEVLSDAVQLSEIGLSALKLKYWYRLFFSFQFIDNNKKEDGINIVVIKYLLFQS